jgi:UPF0716 family protein affecting phage T7 exclusion
LKLAAVEKFALLYILVLIGGIILCGYKLGWLWDMATMVVGFSIGIAIVLIPFSIIFWLVEKRNKDGSNKIDKVVSRR